MKPIVFYQSTVRTKEIFAVLVRHGFANLLAQVDPKGRWWSRFVPQPKERRSLWERVRMAFEELGPTFVKMGQILSMRPDLLPQGLILELRKLQSSVTPVEFEEMRPVLEEGLGINPKLVFAEFDEVCVASASLGQVYKAKLADGREVAVKIQRPNLLKLVQTDLELLAWFAGQLHQRVEALKPYDLPGVVQEVREGMLRELDYEHEARNQSYFNVVNPHPEQVFAPEVFSEFSSKRVLVMEWVGGTPMEKWVFNEEEGKHLAAKGATSLLHQILVLGFFHADPHGGNINVMEDGRICLLDWGMAGNLTKRMRLGLADFIMAAVEQDAERIVQVAVNLGSPKGRVDLRSIEKEVTLALRENFNSVLGHVEMGKMLLRLLFVFGQNGIKLAKDYSLMAKSVLCIEEVATRLDPKFDLAVYGKPVLVEVQKERTGLWAALKEGKSVARDFAMWLRDLPASVQRIVRRLDQDDLTIRFQHQGLENLNESVERASSRITLGVILGALIVSSSLIVRTNLGPFIFGYPALGIVGYLLSALLGLYVIWDILRHGRHR